MKILAIRGANLASLKGPFEVDLAAPPLRHLGLFSIAGPVGAGKSTILDAMCLALFNRTPRLSGTGGAPVLKDRDALRSHDPRSLVRRGVGMAFAEVDVRGVDGIVYRARWQVRRARGQAFGKLQAPELSLINVATSARIGDGTTDTLANIEARIGLSFDELCRSMLLAQGSFSSFLRARPEERAALLEKITGTELYSTLSMRAFARARAESADLTVLEEQLRALAPADAEQRSDLEESSRHADELCRARTAILQRAEARERHIARTLVLGDGVHEAERAREGALHARAISPSSASVVQLARVWPLRGAFRTLDTARTASAQSLASLHDAQDEQYRANELVASLHDRAHLAAATLLEHTRALAVIEPDLERARLLDEQLRCSEVPALREEHARSAAQHEHLAAELVATSAACAVASAVLGKADEAMEREPALAPLLGVWPTVHTLLSQLARMDTQCAGAAALAATARARHEQAQQEHERTLADFAHASHVDTKAEQAVRTAFGGALDGVGMDLAAERAHLRVSEAVVALAALEGDVAERTRTQARGTALTRALHERRTEEATARNVERAAQDAQRDAQDELSRVNALAARAALSDGEACPVCGSLEHPASRDAPAARAAPAGAREGTASKASDVSAHELSAHELSAIDASAIDASAIDASAIDASANDASAIDASLIEASANDASAIDASANDASAIDASLIEASASLVMADARDIVARASHFADVGRAAAESRAAAQARSADALLALSLHDAEREHLLKRARDAAHPCTEAALVSARVSLDGWRSARAALESARQSEESAAHAQQIESAALLLHGDALARLHEERGERVASLAALLGEREAAVLHEPRAALSALNARVALLRAQQLAGLEARARIGEAQSALREIEVRCAGARAHAQQLHLRLQIAQGEQLRLTRERASLIEGAPVAQLRTRLLTAIDQARSDDSEATLTNALAHARAHDAERRCSERQEDARCTSALANASETSFAELARRADVAAEEVAASALLEEGALDAARAAVRALDDDLARSDAVLQERRAALAAHVATDDAAGTDDVDLGTHVAVAHSQLDEALSARGSCTAALLHDDDVRARAGALSPRLEAQRTRAGTWVALADVMGSADGARFRVFAQSLTLDNLLVRANEQLAMLAPRYRLERMPSEDKRPRFDLEIVVVDRESGDEPRGVASLSGGETFLASLALALGLSSLSSARTPVESLFIDEGFSSLDADTLDSALAALEGLRATGRQIGVISHVPALAERIGAQVRVVPLGGGRSRVDVRAG